MRLSLSSRLALVFALLSLVTVSTIGLFLYHSLEKELARRDDQTLAGRLERMENLLANTPSIDVLREQPALYANMLGNTDNVLWVIDHTGTVLIEINPPGLPLPETHSVAGSDISFRSGDTNQSYRLAIYPARVHQKALILVAGKILSEREIMLGQYRNALLGAVVIATLAAALLGWLIARAGLRPVRKLSGQVARINVGTLDTRLDDFNQYPELQPLAARLNQMLARLEHGFLQLSQFSEDLAHEMRTPLNNLIGQSQQCLSRSRSVDDYETLLVSNLEEHERLARMINSMLFLARAEHSGHRPGLAPVLAHDLVNKLLDYFSDIAEEKAIILSNLTDPDFALNAAADLLQRALANLLDNALHHCPPGGSVTVRAEHTLRGTRLTVTNTGTAIAPEHIPRLFERFYRVDQARADGAETGGLGLAIVKSIMAQHGGSATVENSTDGVCFHLNFPLMANQGDNPTP